MKYFLSLLEVYIIFMSALLFVKKIFLIKLISENYIIVISLIIIIIIITTTLVLLLIFNVSY